MFRLKYSYLLQEKLERTVNLRAMTMLDKAEVQYNDLMRKKLTVETDKAKIKKVIAELDRKKKEELRAAWDKVNKDFGSIFSTLLPGSKARLQPPEGLDVLDGLEVKVAFGDVWKESLNELSGGQRSLVALSLILSLLLFKPAPLYILDEVDAALDLSHTQNIGRMLKTHFKHSQVRKWLAIIFQFRMQFRPRPLAGSTGLTHQGVPNLLFTSKRRLRFSIQGVQYCIGKRT